MMPPDDFIEARQRVEAARADFRSAVEDARERLSPHNIRSDLTNSAADSLKQAGETVVTGVRQRPWIPVGTIAAALGAAFLWHQAAGKPQWPLVPQGRKLAAWLRSQIHRWKKDHEL